MTSITGLYGCLPSKETEMIKSTCWKFNQHWDYKAMQIPKVSQRRSIYLFIVFSPACQYPWERFISFRSCTWHHEYKTYCALKPEQNMSSMEADWRKPNYLIWSWKHKKWENVKFINVFLFPSIKTSIWYWKKILKTDEFFEEQIYFLKTDEFFKVCLAFAEVYHISPFHLRWWYYIPT